MIYIYIYAVISSKMFWIKFPKSLEQKTGSNGMDCLRNWDAWDATNMEHVQVTFKAPAEAKVPG